MYLTAHLIATGDDAYLTLERASISAISVLFGPRVCAAIESSQLRAWEIGHLPPDMTECVTMKLDRANPHHGIIRLRIGFILGISIANELYADIYALSTLNFPRTI